MEGLHKFHSDEVSIEINAHYSQLTCSSIFLRAKKDMEFHNDFSNHFSGSSRNVGKLISNPKICYHFGNKWDSPSKKVMIVCIRMLWRFGSAWMSVEKVNLIWFLKELEDLDCPNATSANEWITLEVMPRTKTFISSLGEHPVHGIVISKHSTWFGNRPMFINFPGKKMERENIFSALA